MFSDCSSFLAIALAFIPRYQVPGSLPGVGLDEGRIWVLIAPVFFVIALAFIPRYQTPGSLPGVGMDVKF